ncbi:MBL fold metallo-hydrolase [Micromonospora sp. C95]|uniref:MBL fold metallo-hydrolase n=1 Tax=Micromonospora sp. C95 TaxID=2824882 RepID=UPI001B37E6A6|nr:MBL fold metallo-hydrolase [Micromonospora sp. C95]MBQ1025216.1 MBL fold metallo-hydrolase [Micromonospora sp. C95]
MNDGEQINESGRAPARDAAIRWTALVAGVVAAAVLTVGCTVSGDVAQPPRGSGGVPQTQRPGVAFVSDDGRIVVSQMRQMSVIIDTPAGTIYTDPTGGVGPYAGRPAPDVVLVSHEHAENYDAETLEELAGPDTLLVVPPYVRDRLPAGLRADAVTLANGERSENGGITIEAIPAYGLGGEAERWHPRGRGNGYVVTIDNRRIYVAGSTEAIPEMLELKDIYLAFLPLYPPYALGPGEAVKAVAAMVPEYTYLYQYNSEATREEFVRGLEESPAESVIIAPDITS